MFDKIKPQRPTVIRKKDKVITCHYFKEMNTCLGPRCFWIKVGTCPFYSRIRRRFRTAE